MKMDLHTTQTSTALLCNANGVDAQETKSLCCAAAGIITTPCATAEALISHEKLRGAALADATLIAQKRLPAQLLVDFGSQMLLKRLKIQRLGGDQTTNFRFQPRQNINNFHPVVIPGNVIWINEFHKLHHFHTNVIDQFQKKNVRALQAQSIQPINNIQTAVIDKLARPPITTVISASYRRTKQHLRFTDQIPELDKSRNYVFDTFYVAPLSLMRFHSSRNYHSNKYCNYGTDSLNPIRSIFWKPTKLNPISNSTSQKPNDGTTKEQTPQRPKREVNHPSREFRKRHDLGLLAIKNNRACLLSYQWSIKEVN